MKFASRPHRTLCALLLLVSVLLSSCSGLPGLSAPTETTLPTATSTVTETPTPEPTATETATPEPTATDTAVPTPTKTATPNRTATAIVKATTKAEENLIAIQPDLELYGAAPDSGHLALLGEEPIVFFMDSYAEAYLWPLDLDPVSNFIIQADIKWDSTSGLAGCGMILRSDNDLQKGEQYDLLLMRLQNNPLWALQYYNWGQLQYNITSQVNQNNGNLNDEKASTNRVAVMAAGDQFTTFINGKKIATDQNNKRSEGLTALLGWQESGETTCEFTNYWVWVFDQK